MTFRHLILFLAEHIGHHQIPVRERAVEIRDFIGPEGVHHELITRAVRAIYRKNRCGHLGARVRRGATFQALAPIRHELLRSPSTDIDQFRLMEDLHRYADRYFGTKQQVASAAAGTVPAARSRGGAQVVSIDRALPARRHHSQHQEKGHDRQSGGE